MKDVLFSLVVVLWIFIGMLFGALVAKNVIERQSTCVKTQPAAYCAGEQ